MALSQSFHEHFKSHHGYSLEELRSGCSKVFCFFKTKDSVKASQHSVSAKNKDAENEHILSKW